MYKRIAVILLTLGIGVALGYQMPRGVSLISKLSNIGGDGTSDYSSLKSNQALMEFESLLSDARKMVLKDARTEQEAVEGMRVLLRVAAMSSEVTGDGNPAQPFFQRMDTPGRKVAGDNPDAEYELASIDGKYDYKITGNIGTVRYLGFTVSAGKGMTRPKQIGYISDTMLTLDEAGNFTIILAKEEPHEPGDWIQITEDASSVLVREYIANRSQEKLPFLKIEVLGGNPAYVPPTDETIASAITRTNYAFFAMTRLHKLVLPELMETPNQFFKATSDDLGGDISGADNLYMIGSHQIADDEALLVTVIPPDTRYWNFALETRWHETPDYLQRATSRTLEEVEYSADGSVQFVIAHTDPRLPNWMDTSGHNFGYMTFRWLDGTQEDINLPVLKLVKSSEIENYR